MVIFLVRGGGDGVGNRLKMTYRRRSRVPQVCACVTMILQMQIWTQSHTAHFTHSIGAVIIWQWFVLYSFHATTSLNHCRTALETYSKTVTKKKYVNKPGNQTPNSAINCSIHRNMLYGQCSMFTTQMSERVREWNEENVEEGVTNVSLFYTIHY